MAKLMKLFYLLALCLLPITGLGQVLFINVDNLSTNSVLPLRSSSSFAVSTAVVHFVPKDITAVANLTLPVTEGIAGVLKVLTREGKANLLYCGTRSENWETGESAVYDSLESRPAFQLVSNSDAFYTNRQFGLHLQLRAYAETNREIGLAWEGSFSWSSDLIHLWSADKFLTFGMSVAKVLKPGMVFTEGGDDDAPEQSGINLGSLFGKRKKEAAPPAAAPTTNVSFLNVDFQKVILDGKQNLKSKELAVLRYESPRGKQPNEIIYLLFQPITEP